MSDNKKHTGDNHPGGDNTSPYPVSRLAPQVELVDLAKQIAEADAMVNTRVSAKLQVIADQIRSLQKEALAALEEAKLDQQLHHAQYNFKRIPGKLYHLYRKSNGATYFFPCCHRMTGMEICPMNILIPIVWKMICHGRRWKTWEKKTIHGNW